MRALLEGHDLISPGMLSSSNTEILQVVQGGASLGEKQNKERFGGVTNMRPTWCVQCTYLDRRFNL